MVNLLLSSSNSSAPSPLPYTIALLVYFAFLLEFEFKRRRFKGCNCSGGEHVSVVQLKKKRWSNFLFEELFSHNKSLEN